MFFSRGEFLVADCTLEQPDSKNWKKKGWWIILRRVRHCVLELTQLGEQVEKQQFHQENPERDCPNVSLSSTCIDSRLFTGGGPNIRILSADLRQLSETLGEILLNAKKDSQSTGIYWLLGLSQLPFFLPRSRKFPGLRRHGQNIITAGWGTAPGGPQRFTESKSLRVPGKLDFHGKKLGLGLEVQPFLLALAGDYISWALLPRTIVRSLSPRL